MTRRLLLLNGFAILAVVCNHAAQQAFIAMFWWTHRYNPNTLIPNYDQFGTLTYYILIAILKLTFFAVPTFLFVSGFFISYTSRGQNSLSWKMVLVRVANLLVPYVIWSLIIFFIDWLQSCFQDCKLSPFSLYLVKLGSGGASGSYWYIVLICQYFLLAPLLVSLAKTRLRLLLLLAILAQLGGLIMIYLGLFMRVPRIAYVVFDDKFFPRDMIYFVFGIVAGFHLPVFKQWATRFKWFLLLTLVISAILTLIEAEFIYRITGGGYDHLKHIRGGYTTVPMTVYAITFILCFLVFEEVPIPFPKLFHQLSLKSYGLYLVHPCIIELTPKIIYHLTPLLLAYQLLYQPVLIISGAGIPLLFMSFVAKSRMRGAYRYLFG